MEMINDNDELQCRICANNITDRNNKIHLLDDNARRNYLQTKIRKYLYILVSKLSYKYIKQFNC